MTSLLDLAERVEALTGPCRWTDGLIAIANKAMPLDAVYSVDSWHSGHYGDYRFHCPPDYTASLDAAMTLVPENAQRKNGTPQTPFPRVLRFSEIEWHANIGFGNSIFGVNAKAATPALALIAAALRARAAISGASS